MTSEKQIKANRENAKKGGVKTPEGRAIVRYNALKHGLLSEEILFKGENGQELEELGKKLRSELKPKTTMELILVERIIVNTWRLKRILKMEVDNGIAIFGGSLGIMHNSDLYLRYETTIERGIYKALHELQRIQSARRGEKPPAPLAVDVDVSANQ